MPMEEQKTLVPTVRFSRIQSPSSINTFKQCPRKYYYQYIQRLPTTTSIHLIRGGIVHSTLEDFFSLDVTPALKDLFSLKTVLIEFFKNNWNAKQKELSRLGLAEEALKFYHDESISMLEFWFSSFSDKLSLLSKKNNVADAFKLLTPKVEQEYISTKLGIRGFIDAIHEIDGKVIILDYKTSSKDTMTEDHKLQLAIYAVLYQENHGKIPDCLGINFLKFGEKYIDVDESLLLSAKEEIKSVHEKTSSTNINNYPKNVTSLCKWSTGQCDFYDTCFKNY